MFINGVLFNSETWYNVKYSLLEKLSSVDEYLIRSILEAPSKTPMEALYLETGSLSLKYILKQRRLMYLHHILHRPDSELIKRFYKAQKSKPSKGDWTTTVIEDRNELNIEIDDEGISKLSKYKFRKIVKEKVTVKAFSELIEKKNSHSKMKDNEYVKFKVQRYLNSESKLTNPEKFLLFKFRTRMVEVRKNFRNKYDNLFCQLCKVEEEDQYHLFNSQNILDNCDALAENIEIEYEDIFSTTPKKQEKVAKLLIKMWDTREKSIDNEH